MSIDLRTFSLLLGLGCILQALLLVALYKLVDRYPGLGHYALGYVILALGFMLFTRPQYGSEPWTLFATNGTFFAGLSLMAVGLARFTATPFRSGRLVIVSVLGLAGLAYYIWVDNNLTHRISIASLIVALLLAQSGVMLAAASRGLPSMGRGLALLFLLCSVFMLLRAVDAQLAVVPATSVLPQNTALQQSVPWLIFVSVLLWGMGFAVMVCQRFSQDWRMLASTDPLTGLLNRRALAERLNQEISRCRRGGLPCAVLLLDVDYFKRINDSYGHDGGDQVLKQLAALLGHSLRAHDSLSRHGGEEFLILLPQTPIAAALQLAERLRQTIAATPAEYTGQAVAYTVSIGVAGYGLHGNHTGTLIKAADAALYQAKSQGRNRVVVARHDNISVFPLPPATTPQSPSYPADRERSPCGSRYKSSHPFAAPADALLPHGDSAE